MRFWCSDDEENDDLVKCSRSVLNSQALENIASALKRLDAFGSFLVHISPYNYALEHPLVEDARAYFVCDIDFNGQNDEIKRIGDEICIKVLLELRCLYKTVCGGEVVEIIFREECCDKGFYALYEKKNVDGWRCEKFIKKEKWYNKCFIC